MSSVITAVSWYHVPVVGYYLMRTREVMGKSIHSAAAVALG